VGEELDDAAGLGELAEDEERRARKARAPRPAFADEETSDLERIDQDAEQPTTIAIGNASPQTSALRDSCTQCCSGVAPCSRAPSA